MQNSFQTNQLSVQMSQQFSPRTQQDEMTKNLNKNEKIKFYTKENSSIQEQINDLNEVIKLNSEAIQFTLLQEYQKIDQVIVSGSADNENTSKQTNKSQKLLQFHQIIQQLQKESDELNESIQRLSEERNTAQSKALINEQISESYQKQEKELIKELEQRVNQLQNKIKDDEVVLINMEKVQPVYDEQSQIVIKYREITNTEDQLKKLQQENEKLQIIITKQEKAIINLYQEKRENQEINQALNSQISQKGDLNLNSILAAQKVLLSQATNNLTDDEDNNDAIVNENLPDKVQKMKNIKKANLPGLDLTKAKQIQEQIAQKLINQANKDKEKNEEYSQFEQKINKLDKEIEDTKKKLQKEMLLNKALEIENENIQRFNEEIEARNDILISSQQLMQQQNDKINDELEFYQQYYETHKQFIQESQKRQSTKLQNLQNQQIGNVLNDLPNESYNMSE